MKAGGRESGVSGDYILSRVARAKEAINLFNALPESPLRKDQPCKGDDCWWVDRQTSAFTLDDGSPVLVQVVKHKEVPIIGSSYHRYSYRVWVASDQPCPSNPFEKLIGEAGSDGVSPGTVGDTNRGRVIEAIAKAKAKYNVPIEKS